MIVEHRAPVYVAVFGGLAAVCTAFWGTSVGSFEKALWVVLRKIFLRDLRRRPFWMSCSRCPLVPSSIRVRPTIKVTLSNPQEGTASRHPVRARVPK